MNKVRLILGFILIALIVMVGCNKKSNDSQSTVKKSILIIATTYDAKSLDPHATNDVASSNVM